MPVDGPEHWAYVDAGCGQPRIKRRDWAVAGPAERDADLPAGSLLIGLRPPQGDDQTLANVLDVGVIEPDQLGSAEAAGEADQQQRSVSGIPDRGAQPIKDKHQGKWSRSAR